LRQVIATVGKPGEPGEQVRCVVSVAMLTEGWDANNVTHILGLRAFGSQLLCEQVVGRGLRRMDYTVKPETGLLTEEYVDVYGIPFTLIPFKGRVTGQPEPVDRPKNHVKALPERAHYTLQFPNVEGYVFALRRNLIRADVAKMTPLEIEPNRQPTAVFVRPSVGYMDGPLTGQGPGEVAEHDRQEYYASTHLQAIEFEIARQIVACLVGDSTRPPTPKQAGTCGCNRASNCSRRCCASSTSTSTSQKGELQGRGPARVGLDIYVQRIVERFVAAIEPDEEQGEPPLVPILNRYKPLGTTAEVDFKTTRPCAPATFSHLNQVVL
jgi:type III restriction enzyme